ncbi:MAG: hypothetical protein VKJ64_11885 [Leptolyngbyaceae bacterium]|nr:hypothetical protein [Leptolyngbyaceae bacterium]
MMGQIAATGAIAPGITASSPNTLWITINGRGANSARHSDPNSVTHFASDFGTNYAQIPEFINQSR